ncbi:MAG: C40 family peptidase [Firmicutes bacterium]|nr:C40 family peptidase [Bacillota bacterium]
MGLPRKSWLPLGFLVILALAGCLGREIQQVVLPVSVASDALSYAEAKVGAPYSYGARGPEAFDCSGLIVWAYKQAWPNITFRVGHEKVSDVNMDALWRFNVVPVLPENMQPGDLVFITDDETKVTHGGLFIRWVDEEHFEFINASSYHRSVVRDVWPINGLIRGQWFVGAGRMQTME